MKTGETSGVKVDTATLGGGCFWCLEAAFNRLAGVLRAESGYAGGTLPRPTYEEVLTGRTGHAEVVQVTFDPSIISYGGLLDVFFAVHDPTTPGRQGADAGPQYRSIILYRSPGQKAAAEAKIREITAAGAWKNPIVTEVVPLQAFYRAEDEHQRYYERHPDLAYCRLVIAPKLNRLARLYAPKLKRPGPEGPGRVGRS